MPTSAASDPGLIPPGEKRYCTSMDQMIRMELTRSERELLLNLLYIDREVEKKVVNSRPANNRFPLELDQKEMEGVLNALSGEANHTDDRNLQKAYEELRERLEKIDAATTDGGKNPA
jgi:hypothetical protein